MPKGMSNKSSGRFWNGTIYKTELVLAKKHHLHCLLPRTIIFSRQRMKNKHQYEIIGIMNE